ncbi:MAG: S24/S26 family peptidase [Candidatus Omnitrophota bacterium]
MLYYNVRGSSMWPFLRSGQRIIVERPPTTELRIGDIIVYRSNNQVVCHRLVKMDKLSKGYKIYARGDRSLSAPQAIEEELFLGRVYAIIMQGKLIFINSFVWQVANRFIVIILPLFVRLVNSGQRLFFKKSVQ